jgi:hypothetical protein
VSRPSCAHLPRAGAPLTGPMVAFEVAFLTIQCRDAFGNARVDDGSLLAGGAGVAEGWRLEATAVVTRGSVLGANAETLPVEDVEVMYRWAPPAEGLTNGTYVVRVRAAHAGTLAVTLEIVSLGGRAAVGGGTVTATVVAATATTAELFGPVRAGSCLAGADVPLYLVPRDAAGNRAVLSANATLEVQVFPTHLATVSQAKLGGDGVWVATLTAAAEAAGVGVVVEARLGGRHVVGSPAQLMVAAAYAPVNPLLSFAVRESCRCEKVANRNTRVGTGRQKLALERCTTPKLARRTSSPRYGLQSCRGKSAGVAKRPRELISHPKSLPLRFATCPSLYFDGCSFLHRRARVWRRRWWA